LLTGRRPPVNNALTAIPAQLFWLENVQDAGALDLDAILGVDRATQI
jgi:hypothetical protein